MRLTSHCSNSSLGKGFDALSQPLSYAVTQFHLSSSSLRKVHRNQPSTMSLKARSAQPPSTALSASPKQVESLAHFPFLIKACQQLSFFAVPKGPRRSAVLSRSTAVSAGRQGVGQSTYSQSNTAAVLASLKPPSQRAHTSVARAHSPTHTGYLMSFAPLLSVQQPEQQV